MTGARDGSTVSVVVPTYGHTDDLRRTLRSVQAQGYRQTETVVVDGSDDAESVVDAYDAVECIRQEGDGGVGRARELGVEHAEGAYVRFLRGGLRLRPDALRRQVAVLADSPAVGAVYSGVVADGRVTRPDPAVRGDVLERALALQVEPCDPATLLLDRETVEAVRPLSSVSHDAALLIALACVTRFDFVDEPLLRLKTGATRPPGDGQLGAGADHVVEAYDHLYRRFPESVRRSALARTRFQEGKRRLRAEGWSPAAIRAFLLAAYRAPGVQPVFLGALCASLLGRRGWSLGTAVYDSLSRRRRGDPGV
jgi:glycosyltransferase involved in cell wall biosynthesis